MASDFVKAPHEVLDYVFNWSDWLADGENIATSTFEVTPGLVLDSNSHTALTATGWISAGQSGHTYRLTNKVVTNSTPARTGERSISIRVTTR